MVILMNYVSNKDFALKVFVCFLTSEDQTDLPKAVAALPV